MSKAQGGTKLAELFESLSDITLSVVVDFLGDFTCGGVPLTLHLAEIGVTVFPIGIVGEDEAGQRIFHSLQQKRISTSGISKIKNYATPSSPSEELIHGEHPVLLNVVEHARKFASASDGMYVCDYGIGTASPRVLNFIKSNGCLREKALVARSLHRLAEFEQLSAAVASIKEMEDAIGIEIGEDGEKLGIAAIGMKQELRASSFIAVETQGMLLVGTGNKPLRIAASSIGSSANVDLFGAVFTAALAAGAEDRESVELAAKVVDFFALQSADKRTRREEILEFLSSPKTSRKAR